MASFRVHTQLKLTNQPIQIKPNWKKFECPKLCIQNRNNKTATATKLSSQTPENKKKQQQQQCGNAVQFSFRFLFVSRAPLIWSFFRHYIRVSFFFVPPNSQLIGLFIPYFIGFFAYVPTYVFSMHLNWFLLILWFRLLVFIQHSFVII